MRAVLETINAQGVSDPAAVVFANATAPLMGCDLAFLCEVAPLRAPAWRLRERLSSTLVGVHHDLRTPARAGSALLWRKDTFTASSKRGLALAARPETGDDLRPRWLPWIVLTHRREAFTFLAIAGHRPLRPTGDQPEFDRALDRLMTWAADQGLPSVFGGDLNAPAADVAADLAGNVRGAADGTPDGFLWRGGVHVHNVRALPRTRSDHRPLAADMVGA